MAALVAASAVIAADLHAATATWLGGTGSYTDPAKWSTGVVPNDATTDVFIDGGNAVTSNVTLSPTVNGTTIHTKALNIGSGDVLAAGSTRGGFTLETNGPITVDGELTLVDYQSTLSLKGTNVIDGTGVIRLLSGGFIRPSGDFTIAEGLTVHGVYGGIGRFPEIDFTLTNRGTIVAETFGIQADRLDNFGVINVPVGGLFNCRADFDRSANGGTLIHEGKIEIEKTLINEGQVMSLGTGLVGGGGRWSLLGTVRGGTIRGAGGELHVDYTYEDAIFDHVTLDNATVALSGSLKIVNGIAGVGTLKFANPEALEGSGNIDIGTVSAGITIRGSVADLFGGGDGSATFFKGRIAATRIDGVVRADAPAFPGNPPGYLNLVGAAPIVNAGRIELAGNATLQVFAPAANPLSLSPLPTMLSFADGGSLTVDGSGLMAVLGDLDLASLLDALIVLPKSGNAAYDNQLIATYTGTLTGIFNIVTPGMLVNYLPGEIRITGTPTPEPATLSLAVGGLVTLSRRHRRDRLK